VKVLLFPGTAFEENVFGLQLKKGHAVIGAASVNSELFHNYPLKVSH